MVAKFQLRWLVLVMQKHLVNSRDGDIDGWVAKFDFKLFSTSKHNLHVKILRGYRSHTARVKLFVTLTTWVSVP